MRYEVDIFSESSEPFFFMKEAFVECNSACARLFGVDPSYMVDRSPVEFSPPNQPDGTPSPEKAAVLINAALKGQKQVFFWRHSRIDGSTFDVEVNLSPMRIKSGLILFGSMRDVTERLRAENMLAAAKERLFVTLKSISEGVITTDLYGQTELINPAALDIIGMDISQLVGRYISDVLVLQPDSAPLLVTDPAKEAMRTGRAFISPYPALVANGRGESRPVKFGASPMRDNTGRIIGSVVILRDISEMERLEKALLNTQRIESLGVLAGGIAHDFNNLLAGLFGYIEMGQRHLSAGRTEKTANCLVQALSVFDRARSLTQQLLTFSKGGEPVKKVFSIIPLLESTIAFASAGGMLKIETLYDENLPNIEADESQIAQVVDNIVINAKQAMPNGGLLRISAVCAAECKPPVISAVSCIRIDFEDNGPGIPKEILGKIFDPFFTTKQIGTGLGLSTAFSIIRKHGGLLEAGTSELGGALFRIWLPVSNAAVKIEVASKKDCVVKLAGRVLIMDDDPVVRDTLSDSLVSIGLGCVQVEDGVRAVEAYKKAFEEELPFCFVILDLSIPGGMGGRDTLRKILAIDPLANVVAISGYVEDPILARPTIYGFKAALPKPNTTAEVAAVAAMFCKATEQKK